MRRQIGWICTAAVESAVWYGCKGWWSAAKTGSAVVVPTRHRPNRQPRGALHRRDVARAVVLLATGWREVQTKPATIHDPGLQVLRQIGWHLLSSCEECGWAMAAVLMVSSTTSSAVVVPTSHRPNRQPRGALHRRDVARASWLRATGDVLTEPAAIHDPGLPSAATEQLVSVLRLWMRLSVPRGRRLTCHSSSCNPEEIVLQTVVQDFRWYPEVQA